VTTNQPERFGTYVVIKLLGEGGFAHVYLVEDGNGKRWALKHIHSDLIQKDPSYQEQFAREADIQKKLRHDHIVGVHNFNAEEGYLVLDYVEACETLNAIVEREHPDGMNLDMVFKILEPLEDALTYIHNGDNARPNLAHLDITPKNILLQRKQYRKGEAEWNVQLADFGLARMVDLDGHAKGGASRWGSGTFGFMAPEQVNPQVGIPGFSSDIYSLGLLIGFMLTGRQTGQEIFEILHGTNNTALPPMLPLEVKRVLQRATDEIPDHRYANVQGLFTAFAQAISKTQTVPREAEAFYQGKTQTVPPEVKKRWQTDSGRPPRDFIRPTESKSAGGLKKKVIWGAIAVTLVLLGLIAWKALQPAYSIRLGGLDLNSYCQTFGYNDVTADTSFCTSNLDVTAACRWAYPSPSNVIAENSNSTNALTWYCYTPQKVKLGGITSLTDYCQFALHRDISIAKQQGNDNNRWICEQKVNLKIACILQYGVTDVQARMNEGLWYCYGRS
jgi:serine/threonine protein kinase